MTVRPQWRSANATVRRLEEERALKKANFDALQRDLAIRLARDHLLNPKQKIKETVDDQNADAE